MYILVLLIVESHCYSFLLCSFLPTHAEFTTIRDQFEFDSFYMRCLGEHKDISLRPNTIIRVVNTFLYSGHFWLAWIVDENGTDCELRKIPSPSKYDYIIMHVWRSILYTCIQSWNHDCTSEGFDLTTSPSLLPSLPPSLLPFLSLIPSPSLSFCTTQSQAAVWERRL